MNIGVTWRTPSISASHKVASYWDERDIRGTYLNTCIFLHVDICTSTFLTRPFLFLLLISSTSHWWLPVKINAWGMHHKLHDAHTKNQQKSKNLTAQSAANDGLVSPRPHGSVSVLSVEIILAARVQLLMNSSHPVHTARLPIASLWWYYWIPCDQSWWLALWFGGIWNPLQPMGQ